jgi:phosphoenolpyruvate carboxylase
MGTPATSSFPRDLRTLSQDVHWVGDTLGQVIRAHGGDALFDAVETLRLSAKVARGEDDASKAAEEAARKRLAEVASELDPEMALDVARAFTLYFQLVNVAEDVHRSRELRRREAEGGGPVGVAESLARELRGLAAEGATREEILRALGQVRLGFVFTAHPTEARRRTTERLLADVRRCLDRKDRERLTPTESQDLSRHLAATIESLWEHAAEREERPSVLEEVKAGLWYFRNVLLDTLPRFQRQLRAAFEAEYGEVEPLALPAPVRFGSWMGGDRDGNPYVDDAATERTLELHRRIVLERYLADLDGLVDPLAAVDQRVPLGDRLEDAMVRAAAAVPEAVPEADRRNPRETLRRFLTFVRARLERTLQWGPGAYPTADAFLDDLLVMRDTLLAARAVALPEDRLLDLIERVRVFGFVLASLDVREDSRAHRPVVAELLGDADYEGQGADERVAALSALALPERGVRPSPGARRLLDLFASLRRFQARFGPEAVSTYVISMTESAADVLEVLRLAELHGIDQKLDIVPLLETPGDLARAGELLDALFANPTYRRHLSNRGNVQELLVGYSDSMKEGGILASRVRILGAQRLAAEACGRAGVHLRLFHGRGGSVSRGGGPTHRALRALPREAFSGDVKITEQGEMRAANFAHPDLALRYLEQTVGAALRARWEALDVLQGSAPPPSSPEHRGLSGELAEASQRAYRALVERPALLTYFTQATPFEFVAELNIASRPSKRKAGTLDLSSLRAIPWVFSWSQSRHVLTGWYGVGTAIAEVLAEPGGRERLRSLHGDSAFFQDLLDNVAMALAKSDLAIAERYARLCADPAVRDEVFGAITDEHRRTREALAEVTGDPVPLASDPVLRKSIRLRNPYVDPLSYLQVEAMARLAAGPRSADETACLRRLARLCVHGIAAGIRHTG